MYSRAWRKLTPFVAALAVAVVLPAQASAAPYGSRTLTLGAHGGDVKKLQRYLVAAGHRVARDGEFGPRTQRALKTTETELELTADGIATAREQRTIKRAVNDPGSGGASYVAPPPPEKVVPGAKGSVTADGFAVPPETAPEVVKNVIAAGNAIATTPYKWGGGHRDWDDTGYDCSGSVSYALHGGGLLSSPLDSSALMSYGAPGPGRHITIYANPGHAYMTIDGRRFDTSARGETGTRWSGTQRGGAGYVVRHPIGY
jgi:cell wall-associated NlpC family hydrolase